MVASDAELLRITQVYAACMVTLSIWDWLVCLGQEWNIIWKAKWSLVKVLYLIARYWSLFAMSFSLWSFTANFSYSECEKVVHWIPSVAGKYSKQSSKARLTVSAAIITLSTEAILAVRTYAIWGRPRWLLAVIVLCFTFEVAAMIAGSIAIKPVFPPGLPFETPCIPTSGNAVNYLYFISPFVIDSIFTALCFYKAAQIAKAGEATSVLKLFLRDGLLYFSVVSVANIVQTGFYIQPVAAMKVINAFAALCLSSVMCCRLVLSLKSFNSQQANRYVSGETELSNRSVPKHGNTFPILARTERITVTDNGSRSEILSQGLHPTIDVTNVDLEKAMSRKESTAETLRDDGDVADEKSLHLK